MLEIKGIKFEVSITRKRIRNIYLRVDGNLVNATCPYYVADYEVYKFIETKRDWIYKAYIYNDYKQKHSLMYSEGDYFYIFNTQYHLIKQIGKPNVTITNDCIYLTYKQDNEDAIRYLYKYLDSRLLIKAYEYLDKYLYILKDYGYNQYPEIKAKTIKSKWGVCYTRKNSIHISSYLIHYPLECLEYIIIHELTHFIIPNHSKRFYEIIQNNMPNYKQANAKLK